MLKGAFIGGTAPGLGPASFSGKDLELTAFCPERSFHGTLVPPPGTLAYETPGSLLTKETGLDFAAINLPPEESFNAIELALHRGLHVICEPPFCVSTTEFETLRAAAEKAKKIIFPVQPWEHAAPWRALSMAITRGLAGEINHAEIQALLPGPAPAGGAAAALGWQSVSMLLSLVRRPPSAIEARLTPATAALHAHFGEADGFIHLSCGAHAPRLRAAVSGEKGRLEMDGNLLRMDIKGLPRETVELKHELAPGACRPEWLTAELSAFKEELGGGRERGTGLRNAKYCVKLLRNASYSASVKSAAVPL